MMNFSNEHNNRNIINGEKSRKFIKIDIIQLAINCNYMHQKNS